MIWACRAFTVAAAAAVLAGSTTDPQRPAGSPTANSVLGGGNGIDHVGIAVRDLDFAAQVYMQALGFTVAPGAPAPEGIGHRIIRFGPTSLELVTADPSRAAGSKDASDLVRFLATREGAAFLGLHVSSAQRTAAFLRARQFDIEEPEGSSTPRRGSPEARPALWLTVGFRKPAVPGGRIFFIQYADGLERPAPSAHPNTAIGVRSVWMAVGRFQAATRAYESIGLAAGEEVSTRVLGATGREILAGRGVILLLQANDPAGPVGSFLSEHGEGIAGVSLEVQNLEVVRTLMENSTEQAFKTYRGLYGESILVAPAFTHGVWIEFFKRPPG